MKRGEDVPTESANPMPAADPASTETGQPVLGDADMPPVESLDESSDFSCFLSEGVSEGLRRQALDRLFRLPMCGVLDGLNDYDDDYTKLEELGTTVTYQMRQWAEEKARRALAAEPSEQAPRAATPADRGEDANARSATADLDDDADATDAAPHA